jgi:hypothetical protein
MYRLTIVAALAALAACRDPDASAAYAGTAAPAAPASPPARAGTDPQPTIEQLLADFRRTITVPAPSAMRGEPSKTALVRRFVRSLEHADTNAFREMAFDRAEFAYLYYPESPYTHRPFRQDPALLWFMIQQGSNKGLTRLMRRLGGRPLGFVSFQCPEPADVHGDTRLWPHCSIRRVLASGDTVEQRLFGSIVERDGRFKFMSYANDF